MPIPDRVLEDATRVVRGAELLDKEKPDWRERINLDELDIGDCNACVLGQVFGSYLKGLNALGLTIGAESREHGFLGDIDSKLDDLWKEVIG